MGELYAQFGMFMLLVAVVSVYKYGRDVKSLLWRRTFIVSSIVVVLMIALDMKFDITPASQIEKNNPPQPKVEQVAENPKPAPQNVHYKGRGFDGRSEPDYVGLAGFVAVWYDEQEYLMTNLNYTYTPWQVPTYTRDKQFWVKSDETIDHKTQIIVREQFLTHEGYDNYSGYLRVEIPSGQQVFINVRNFVTKPYWTYQKVADALKYGCVIVTYHQQSDFYPVSVDNKKVEVPDGLNLLATGFTGVRAKGFADNSTNQIKINFTPNAVAFFNENDLTVSY